MSATKPGERARTKRVPRSVPGPEDWPADIPIPKAGPYMVGQHWTTEEEDLVRQFFPLYGDLYVARLLGRTAYGVNVRAHEINLRPGSGLEKWSSEETETLRSLYGHTTTELIARTLGRTRISVRLKIEALGLRRQQWGEWTKTELEFLRRNDGQMSIAAMARALNRPYQMAHEQVNWLRAGTKRTNRPLTEADRRFIRNHNGSMSIAKIARKRGLTEKYVRTYVWELGNRHEAWQQWSRHEDEQLRALYGTMSRAEIARRLGRGKDAVNVRAELLGITRPKKKPDLPSNPWTAQEDDAIRSMIATHTYAGMARVLTGRTANAIKTRAHSIGLHKYSPNPFSKREDGYLRRWTGTFSSAEIGRRIGRPEASVWQRQKNLGLTRPLAPHRRAQSWTAEEDTKLRQRFRECTHNELAEQLGHTRASVIRRCRRLGLEKR